MEVVLGGTLNPSRARDATCDWSCIVAVNVMSSARDRGTPVSNSERD